MSISPGRTRRAGRSRLSGSASATLPRKSLIPPPEQTEAERQADDEETDDHGVLGRALALLLGDELHQLERNPLEHSLPPIRTCRPALEPALLDSLHLGRRARGAPHREGVDRTTPSDQLPVWPTGDNRAVADHIDLTRSDGQPVCRARVAGSFAARFRGLMGAADLPAGEGLLFPAHELRAHALHALPDRRRLPRRRAPRRRDQAGAPPVADGVREGGALGARARGGRVRAARPRRGRRARASARRPEPTRGRARRRSGAPRSGS